MPPDFRSRILPIILTQGFGIACGVFGVKLATFYVAPDDYGRFGIFGTLAPLGVAVVYAGLVRYVARFWAAADHAAMRQTVRQAAGRKIFWLVLVSVLAAVVANGDGWWRVAPFLLVSALALAVGTLAQNALQASRENWRDSGVAGFSSLLRSFAPTLCYVLAGGGMVALYTGFVLHAIGFAVAALWALRSVPAQRQDTPPPPLTSAYDGPLFTLLAAADWVIFGLNRWVVAFFYGATAAGFFSLAANLAVIVPSIMSAFVWQYFQPRLFSQPHETTEERQRLAAKIDRVAAFVAAGTIAGLLLLRAVVPWLMGLVIGPKYAPSLDYVLPAGAFLVATSTAMIFGIMLQAGGRASACGRVGLTHSAVLAVGCIASAWVGAECFSIWLLCSPVVPWLVSRPLARHYLFKPARP